MRCPKCKIEIKELIFEDEVTFESRYRIEQHGNSGYFDEVKRPITSNYLCPICKAKLCKYEAEADELLKNDPYSKVEAIIKEHQHGKISDAEMLERLKNALT